MKNLIYWNGRFMDAAVGCVPLADPMVMYGLGAFTTVKIISGQPEYLDLHFERLEDHCKALNLPKPTLQRLVIDEYIHLQGATSGCWRLKIVASTHVGMTLQTYTPPTSPRRLCIYPEPVVRPTARLKSLSYLDRWWIKDYAEKQGCDDALVVDAEGHILETAFANIFWKKGNDLYLPDLTLPLLVGVGLQVMLRETKAHIHQVRMKPHEMDGELFVCNALMGVLRAFLPLPKIDTQQSCR